MEPNPVNSPSLFRLFPPSILGPLPARILSISVRLRQTSICWLSLVSSENVSLKQTGHARTEGTEGCLDEFKTLSLLISTAAFSSAENFEDSAVTSHEDSFRSWIFLPECRFSRVSEKVTRLKGSLQKNDNSYHHGFGNSKKAVEVCF